MRLDVNRPWLGWEASQRKPLTALPLAQRLPGEEQCSSAQLPLAWAAQAPRYQRTVALHGLRPQALCLQERLIFAFLAQSEHIRDA